MRNTRQVFLAAVVAWAAGGAAASAGDGDRTGAIPVSARAQTPTWSGEDGASGNPLMTAAAIRASAANFPHCIDKMWPLAARRGVSRASFERLTAHLAPDLRIMDLLDSQPEFTKAVWDYLDILVNDNRIAKGRAVLAKYERLFDDA